MIRSDQRCEPIPAHSVSGVVRKIPADAGAVHDDNRMDVGAVAGGAMRPYVQLNKLIQE